MLFRTHVLFAIAIFLIAVPFIEPIWGIPFLILISIGSKIPDIDTPNSNIGKKIRPISNLINVIFKHRGFFHSLIFIIIVGIILFLTKIPQPLTIALLLGYLSHLLLDLFSDKKHGIFWPFQIKFKGPIKTASISESVLFVALIIVSLILFIVRFPLLKTIVLETIKTIF